MITALAAALWAQNLGDMSDLSDAYNKARSLAHSFRNSSGSWNEPTWNPVQGPSFTAELPKTPGQKALDERKAATEKRISRLALGRDRWSAALEKIQKNQDWQKDLMYYAEEGQAASVGAIMASLSLLIGVSGAVEAAVETHRGNAALLFSRLDKDRERVKQAKAILDKAGRNPRLGKREREALEKLVRLHDELVQAMKSENGLVSFCKALAKFGDRAMDAAVTLELMDDMIVKQDLELAAKLIQDTVVDILKEMGLVKLKKMGYETAAKAGRVATFVIDYSYQGYRFYEAWSNVDLILHQAQQQRLVTDRIGRTIVRMTDKVNELKGELRQIEQAGNAGEDRRKQVLYELRAKDFKEAHLMGEWFANETGIRAPGGPILQEDR